MVMYGLCISPLKVEEPGSRASEILKLVMGTGKPLDTPAQDVYDFTNKLSIVSWNKSVPGIFKNWWLFL